MPEVDPGEIKMNQVPAWAAVLGILISGTVCAGAQSALPPMQSQQPKPGRGRAYKPAFIMSARQHRGTFWHRISLASQ